MAQNINKYYIEGENESFRFLVHWLRLASSETESLLTEPQEHDFYELQYVISGGIKVSAQGTEYSVSKGEYLLIYPKTNHATVKYKAHTEKLVFGFSADFTSGRLPKNECAVKKESTVLKVLSKLLISIEQNEHPYSYLQARCLAEALISELFSSARLSELTRKYKKNGRSYKEELVLKMENYIRVKVKYGNVAVSTLAAEFNLSSRQLSRICTEIRGKTPHRIIDEIRLEALREVLMTSSDTLSSIAASMGFSCENVMTRFFAKYEGYTPGQYRKYITQK